MNAKALVDYAYQQGEDVSYSLHKYMDYVINLFDARSFLASSGNTMSIMSKAMNENPFYFGQMLDWFQSVETAMDGPIGWLDAFGLTYEDVFKSKSKSSLIGQFYTPAHISDMLGKLGLDIKQPHICDPACGSGRNLLAHFASSGKEKFHFYFASDIDLVSCKMCVLNMMIHGMIGVVVCRNAVSDNDFKAGWMINEIRYPLPCNWYSIRPITKEEYLNL